MADTTKNDGPSRRGFLGGVVSGWLLSLLPGGGRAVAAIAPVVQPIGEPVDPFLAAAANPNCQRLYNEKMGGAIIRHGKSIYWLERDENGDIFEMKFEPATPMECAEADEYYELFYWRSWNTPGELAALVNEPGQWVIRANLYRRKFRFLTAAALHMLEGKSPFDPESWRDMVDDVYTNDVEKSARFTAEQVMAFVPRLTDLFTRDEQDLIYFEPVRPEHANKDFRMLHMRTGGWGPQVGQTYDVTDLEKIFTPGRKWALSSRHPFVQTPDGLVALIDFGKGPGAAIFESPDYICWRPAQRAKSANVIANDSDFPPAMLAAEKPGPSHLLVRKGNSGRYTYIGVGYLDDGVQNGAARLRIVPPVETEMFDAIGGYGGWEIRIDDSAGRGRTQRIKRAGDIRALVKDLGPEFSGTVITRRWATGEMKIIADGKRAAVSFRGSESADPRIKYWVPAPRKSPNPSSSSAGKARNNPPGHPSENRVIVKKALKAMQMFVLGDGDLPVPSHWITTEPAPPEPANDAEASKALHAAMQRYRVRTRQNSFVRIADIAAPIMKPIGVLPHDSRVTAMGTSTAGGLHTTDGARIWIWTPCDRQLVSSEPMGATWGLAIGHGESDFPLILASWQKIYIAGATPDFEGTQKLVCSSDTFGKVQKLEISSNDRLLIANSRDREVAVWDIRSALETHYFRSESGPIMAIGFSTTKSPLVAYLDDQELVVRDLAGDRELMRAKTIASFAGEDDETPSAGVFIRDGRQLAVAVDEVEVWDVDRGQQIRSIPCSHGKIASLAIEPHTQRLLAIAPHAGPVMVVDVKKAKVLHTLGGKNESLTPVHFNRDGDYLFAAADEGVRIWNVADFWPK